MVYKMAAILKQNSTWSQLKIFSDSFQQWLYLENLTNILLLFLRFEIFKMTSKMAAIKRVGNHMVFAMIHCIEKITDSYFS